MRKASRAILAFILAASVTTCLSTGIASATKVEGKGAHSCCPVSPDKAENADDTKTSAGAPKCCLFITAQGKVAHAVFKSIGFHACDSFGGSASPVMRSVRAVIPASDALRELLTKAVFSIRAPPQA